MVVGLKQGRAAPLQDDDDGVDDLVKLGEVEEVAPVAEGAVPQALIRIAVLLKGKTDRQLVVCNIDFTTGFRFAPI